MTKKIAFIARTARRRQKEKRRLARIILVYCPLCEMFFFDVWKPVRFWREFKDLDYICPYCEAVLKTWWIP